MMRCYLCKSEEFEKVNGQVRDIPDLAILRCKNCGLVFLESFDHISASFYEESKMRENDPSNPALEWEASIKEGEADDQRRVEYLYPIVTNKSILDFGCGAGGLLLKIRGSVVKCAGVEKDLRFSRILQKEKKLKIFFDIEEIKEKYDVITLFHVLEHLKDPKGILLKLSKLLNPAGAIIVELPNADDALLTLYECKAFAGFTYWSPHLYLFNNSTLTKMIKEAGLKINHMKQIQRYPFANHLYWLSKGKPGGHHIWNFLNDAKLNKAYESQLANLGKCDTIVASISKYD